jgi:hypothetical protein
MLAIAAEIDEAVYGADQVIFWVMILKRDS